MRLFGANHVDLVVINDSLMDSVWHEASCQMKHLKPEVPIILYTAFTELSNEPHCADLILSKGMHPDEFLAEVANLIAKRRAPGPAA
jgi:two-component SAPR family response regulator